MEEAQMIINIANKALIYTAFCSWVSANTASQYLSIKSHIPWRETASLSPRKTKNKIKKKNWRSFCVYSTDSFNSGIKFLIYV